MYSYFAVIAKTDRSKHVAEHLIENIINRLPQYGLSFKEERLYFLETKCQEAGFHSYFLHSGLGIIAGTLFRRSAQCVNNNVYCKISEKESRIISSQKGRHLVREYWGRYFAAITSHNKDEYYIIRDPSGTIPCYYVELDDIIIFFSDGEHFRDLHLITTTINWQYVTCFLKSQFLNFSDTGINEIQKLLPGYAIHINNNGCMSQSIYWRHLDFCMHPTLNSPSEAAFILKKTVTECIHAWASQFDSILLSISGGLDSSIVLACLQSAPNKPRITCVTHFSPKDASDERHFARLMVGQTNAELIEIPEDPSVVDIAEAQNFPIQPDLRPWRQQIGYGNTDIGALNRAGADAFFTGEGGDMVFYQGGRDIIGDYLSHHGFDRGALLQVLLYARLHGLSFWLALWKAIKERASPTPWKLCEWNDKAAVILMPDTLFHSADLWTRSRYWAESLEYLPQAKARHIATMTLMNDMARPNARGRYLQVVQPLFSQPLVELAIQIPTYMFSWPGVDRGLARLAFADLLPNKILFRQSKGSPGSYFDQIFDKNFCKIKEILRNSPLLDNGMFDPEKFKECFENGKKQNSQLKGYVMETISCHYWLERWMRSH